jgi:hypothetical protein
MSLLLLKWLQVVCTTTHALEVLVGFLRLLGRCLLDGAYVVLIRNIPAEIRICSPLLRTDAAATYGREVFLGDVAPITVVPINAAVVEVWIGMFAGSGSHIKGGLDLVRPSINTTEGHVDGTPRCGRCVEGGRPLLDALYVFAADGCRWSGWWGQLLLLDVLAH